MNFEFATAGRIIFGAGAVRRAGPLALEMGRRVFVVTGKTVQRAEVVVRQLQGHAVACELFSVAHEPTVAIITEAVEQARRSCSEVVVSIGGGSVLDSGKAVAAMLTNTGQLTDYLEVIGRGRKIAIPAAPHIAIPTTAGTGAEVTRNAVLTVPQHQVKVSMRSPLMLPRIALVDPELSCSMPPAVTASTGLDALTQLIEAFVSVASNPLTDGLCREGLVRAGRSLRKACEDGRNKQAREDMAIASLFSGLALANAKLGAVHGFAGPIGGMTAAPHGVICASLLPHVVEANVRALRHRGDPAALARFDELGRLLTGEHQAGAPEAVAWIRELCGSLEVPALSEYGFASDDFGTAVAKARKASSMKGNPVELTAEELEQILCRAAGLAD